MKDFTLDSGDKGFKMEFNTRKEMKQAEAWLVDDGFRVASNTDNTLNTWIEKK